MIFVLITCLSVAWTMGAALLLDWRWPQGPERRLALVAALTSSVPILLVALWALFNIDDTSDSPDAAGHVVLATFVGASFAMVISLAIGFPAAVSVLRYLRAG